MKTFLIIIGCIFLYILGIFMASVLFLYCERCEFEPYQVYDDDNEELIMASLFWPITIWFALGYLLYLKLKKYAIAITEFLYQINHKEDKDER